MMKMKSKNGRQYEVVAINENECVIYDTTNPFKKKLVTVYAGAEYELEENLKAIGNYESKLTKK